MSTIAFARTLVNGVVIHHAQAGEPGRPLMLFLHGFPEFWFAWHAQLLEFSRDHFVVAPDTRGINLSGKPAKVADYRAQAIVADLVELVQALGYRQCVLVGHDWGGALAFAMAIARPAMVQRLVILNAVHPWTFARELCHNPAQARASDYMNLFRQPDAAATLLRCDCAWLRSMLADAGGAVPGWFDTATAQRYLTAWTQPGAIEAGLNYYRASPLYPATATEPGACAVTIDPAKVQVTMPTLVLWGERDRHLLSGCLDGLDEVVPDLTVRRFAHASHWIAHEQPESVNRAMRQFLGTNDGTAAYSGFTGCLP